MSKKTPEERFYAKLDRGSTEGACWVWTGALSNKGYGFFNDGHKTVVAHRWSYEHHVGPIPEGLQLDHRCHSVDRICVGGVACVHRACVNPAHLEPVTGKVNIGRVAPMAGARRGLHHTSKNRCPRGHEYSAENTYVRTRSDGGINRVCRTCKRIRWAADAAKKPKAERQVRTGFVSASRKAWPEDLDRARMLMAEGASLREAARQIGLSHTQLRRRLLGIN